MNVPVPRASSSEPLARRLVGGGLLLTIAMIGTNGGNYALNIALGRWLTPAEFADANLMVVLMLLVAAIAAPLQLVAARYSGIHDASGTQERGWAMIRWLATRARRAGVLLAVAVALPAWWWMGVFNTASPRPFVILAFGLPAYVTQAVRRGVLQGHLAFGRLAASYLVEMIVRLAAAAGLVVAGFGVAGATAGLSLSFVATWLFMRRVQPLEPGGEIAPEDLVDLRRYIAPTIVFLVAQIVINNGDVLIVKSRFPRDVAGIYSAVALMGRAVFFLSWTAVATLFPAAARRDAQGGNTDTLLLGGLVVVAGSCAAMVSAAALFGDAAFRMFLGPEYANLDGPLVRYATATSLFAVANLIATHQLSVGRVAESRVILGGALAQTMLLLALGSTVGAVIDLQRTAMSWTLLVVLMMSIARLREPAHHIARSVS